MRKSQKHTGQPIRIKRWFNAGTYGPGSPGRQQPRSIELSVPLLPDPQLMLGILRLGDRMGVPVGNGHTPRGTPLGPAPEMPASEMIDKAV